MSRQRKIPTFRNSLSFRVLITTLTISLVVLSITGAALNSRLTGSIKKVKAESSISEADSAIYAAQYQFYLAQGYTPTAARLQPSPLAIKKVVESYVKQAADSIDSFNAREMILLKADASAFVDTNYGKASGGLDPDSLSKDFRSRVRGSQSIQSEFLTMKYLNGQKIPGFAAGRQIEIPGAGQYEMYFIFSLVNQQASINVVNRSIFIAFIVLLLMIALITSLLIRQVVRPIRRAAVIADEFAVGKFNDRMEVLNEDEIARLGTAFNTMADAIQAQITRLENLSRVQQRFVSDVTHELRTPLTTLRMASEVLYSARASFEPSVARSAELLVAQIDRFELLLEDLLEVSRFDAEVAVLEGVEFDLEALLSRSIEDLALVAQEHKTQLLLKSDFEPIFIKADIRRVERILRNLMSNAIDHAEGKPVEITIVASDSEVAVGVRDFGIGIDKNSLSRVFDRFWRADPSRARTRGGTGLGLSIALEDARLHNGELDAWGRPGKGAHFVLTLPRNYGNQIERRLIAIEPKDLPRSETASPQS